MDSCLLQFGSLEMNASSSSETQATLCTFFGNLRHFIHLFLWEFTVELNEEAALITTGISAHPKHNVCTVGRWKRGDSSGSHSHWGTPRGPRGPPAKQLTNGLFYCESTHAKRLRITVFNRIQRSRLKATVFSSFYFAFVKSVCGFGCGSGGQLTSGHHFDWFRGCKAGPPRPPC